MPEQVSDAGSPSTAISGIRDPNNGDLPAIVDANSIKTDQQGQRATKTTPETVQGFGGLRGQWFPLTHPFGHLAASVLKPSSCSTLAVLHA